MPVLLPDLSEEGVVVLAGEGAQAEGTEEGKVPWRTNLGGLVRDRDGDGDGDGDGGVAIKMGVSSDGFPIWATVLLSVVGGILVVLLLLALYLYYRRRRKASAELPDTIND